MRRIQEAAGRLIRAARSNIPMAIAFSVIFSAYVALVTLHGPGILVGSSKQSANPLVLDRATVQEVGDISVLAGLTREGIESVQIAGADSAFPRYVVRLKDDAQVKVVKVPFSTHLRIEEDVLIRNNIPYAMADEKFVKANAELLTDPAPGVLSKVGGFMAKHGVGIALIALILWQLRAMMGNRNQPNLLKPEDIAGDLNDLIGMEDIKREVLHLEDRFKNREKYAAHGIDKTFNVMLTGPAGTGKSKMVGYLAKRLNMPVLTLAGSSLETGVVGGGSRTLTAIQKQAEKLGRCIVFLDEGQGLFMQRGRSKEKWADDTANTLLSILDGVSAEPGKEVVWVVASNFSEDTMQMDEAMLRRFAVKINFRLPNKSERKAIIKAFLETKQAGCVDWENLNLDYAADITANLSPALLETVTNRASLIAIEDGKPIDTQTLFRAFERATIGLTDRATTAEKTRQRERIAIHEMGHFLMQVEPLLAQGLDLAEVKERVRTLKISTESVSRMNALGYVLSSGEDVGLQTLEDLENRVMELYGGVAAEEVFFGKRGISVGSGNDIQKATELLTLMVERLSMYSGAKLDYSQLAETEASRTVRAMEERAEALYAKTVEALGARKALIETLKDVLMERYVLTKDEVFEILAREMAPQAV